MNGMFPMQNCTCSQGPSFGAGYPGMGNPGMNPGFGQNSGDPMSVNNNMMAMGQQQVQWSNMMTQMMDVPLRDFAAMAGEDGEALKAKMGPGTLKQVMAIIDPNDLIGRTYLTNPAEDGQRMRLRIVEILDKEEQERLQEPSHYSIQSYEWTRNV